jgi:N-acetyl-anhydromuramyl-L-alanine amidase AmpD
MRATVTLMLGVMVGLLGCAPQSPPLPAAHQGSALEAAFVEAATRYQVPVAVLESLAWVETRVAMQASASGGWGLMQLARRDGWDTLGRASALTGFEVGQLQVDARANVLGAAAVLRDDFDRLGDRSLDAREAGDWYRVVALYPGYASVSASNDYATDVFLRLEQGFAVNGVTLAPGAASWRRHAPAVNAQRDALGDYTGIASYQQSPNFASGRSTYEFVVVHTMEGSYSGSISWFLSTASQVSAHYLVRSSDGQITQMVMEADTAWHVQCYNSRAVGIEHEGFIAAPATWYTEPMYVESAKLARSIADRHSVPLDRTHFIGHNEVPSNCNTNNHQDPGSGWNWTHYMALVTGSGPTTTTGVFTGVIYSGGNTANLVSGAQVSAGGQTMTTAADGVFTFTLAPGSYTATVTKSGYSTNQATRTVTANATIWGSMEINPAQATGTLGGTVYAYDATNPANHSQALAGASVTVGAQTVSSDASGHYSFTLPPGTVTVSASLAGYAPAQASSTITAAQGTTVDLGLTSTTGPDVVPPTVVITRPSANASLTVGMADLAGTASDDRGPVASVTVSLNGGTGQVVPVVTGAFATQVLLAPGVNQVTVSTVDAANNVGIASVSTTFLAGVSGRVVDASTSLPLANVTVDLRQASTGALLVTTTTDAQGHFFAAATVVPADELLVVHASGFLTSSQTVTVPVDQQLVVTVPLTAGVDQVGAVSLTITQPAEGDHLTTDTAAVFGTANGFDLIGVTVDGVTGQLLAGGGFSATVPLTPGPNTLEVTGTGTRGEVVSATVHVTRTSGGPAEPVVGLACSTTPAGTALALALLLLARRRRA